MDTQTIVAALAGAILGAGGMVFAEGSEPAPIVEPAAEPSYSDLVIEEAALVSLDGAETNLTQAESQARAALEAALNAKHAAEDGGDVEAYRLADEEWHRSESKRAYKQAVLDRKRAE